MGDVADISGRTKVCFIIGKPIAQVLTPPRFNAAARRRGADAVMAPLEVPPEGLDDFMRAMRGWGNCLGCVVTYPHKQAAFDHLDEAAPAAQFLFACNVIRREADGRLAGAITDGLGYAAALAKNGADPAGVDFLLIGAGGAGSAIAYVMARLGAGRLAILDLDATRRDALLARLGEAFPSVQCFGEVPEDFRLDIVCNATPVGMNGDPRVSYPPERLREASFVTDIVPTPAMTPFLKAAAARGLRVQTGAQMVDGQMDLIMAHLGV